MNADDVGGHGCPTIIAWQRLPGSLRLKSHSNAQRVKASGHRTRALYVHQATGSGSDIWKAVPFPGWLDTSNVPWWACTTFAAIASPQARAVVVARTGLVGPVEAIEDVG